MKAKKLIKVIFCANEQKETDHVLTASQTGEIIATCDCGRFLKFPKGIQKEEFEQLLAEHKASNEGQVTQKEIQANLEELI